MGVRKLFNNTYPNRAPISIGKIEKIYRDFRNVIGK